MNENKQIDQELSVEQKQKKANWFQRIIDFILWLPKNIWGFFRRLYYRSYYFLIYKARISEYIVIDFRILLAFVSVLGVLLIWLYPQPLYFSYPTLSTQLYIVENTLRTVSIFISIVFSFIVLSFNVFYKYFGRLTFIRFFNSSQIKFIFTLFIGDIVLLLYTAGYLKELAQRQSYSDALFAFSLAVSMVLVLAIIPTLILLLRSSQDRGNIEKLIASFDVKWSFSYHVNVLWKGNKNLHFQRDPITLLTEIGTAAIKDFDKRSIVTIKKGCINHLIKMHTEYKKKPEVHPAEFYHNVYDLARNLFPLAIKERNENAAIILLQLVWETEDFYIRHFDEFNVHQTEKHNYDGILFTVVVKEFLVKSLQFNEDNVSERIVEDMRDWWGNVIKIYLLERKYDYPAGERFVIDPASFLISSMYGEFDRIFDQIFAYKKYFLFKAISSFYSVIDSEIIGSKNARNTIVYLLQLNGSYKMSVLEKFLDETSTEISFTVYPFGHVTALELTSVKSQVPLSYELRAFELLFRKSRLNAYVINMIKASAYHLMGHFSEDQAFKGALLKIINNFDSLRGFIKEDDTDQRKEVYILLERYLSYLRQPPKDYKVNDDEFEKSLESVLAKFIFKEKFEIELAEKGYVIKDVR